MNSGFWGCSGFEQILEEDVLKMELRAHTNHTGSKCGACCLH